MPAEYSVTKGGCNCQNLQPCLGLAMCIAHLWESGEDRVVVGVGRNPERNAMAFVSGDVS